MFPPNSTCSTSESPTTWALGLGVSRSNSKLPLPLRKLASISKMKTCSLDPNVNRETTSYPNFVTFQEDQHRADPDDNDTTLNKRPKTNDTEPSETSPFKGILSTSLSFNEMNENHSRIVEFFPEWDQMDQSLAKYPPSPNGSDSNVSVGSNQFSGDGGSRQLEIVLIAGGREVSIHPCILSARSPFLNNLFSREERRVKLELKDFLQRFFGFAKDFDVSFDAFVTVLAYLYGGNLRSLRSEGAYICVDDECEHVACRPAVDFLVEVFYASYVFQIPELVARYQGADPAALTSDGGKALEIAKMLPRAADYCIYKSTDQGKAYHEDRLCIEILEQAERRDPLLGEASASLVKADSLGKAGDDLPRKLLYLESRVELAKLIFPMEAKVAMDIALVDGTSEFTLASINSKNMVGAQRITMDLNDALFKIDDGYLNGIRALSKTVELEKRFFPHCSEVLNKMIDDDDWLELKGRCMELQDVMTKAFHEDRGVQ